jgi:predicted MPP superfamily phosphohydrolase
VRKQWSEWAWNAWCIASGIGIWPRYIEPRVLDMTRLALPIPNLPSELEGLSIVHFSDLHWNNQFSTLLRRKLIRKVNSLQPDLILFTGDFLCRSRLENPEGLKLTLESLKANVGCFAVLGNHDYDQFVTVNKKGDYDVEAPSKASNISKGFKRLFCGVNLTKHVTDQARQVKMHEDLMTLLQQTPFQLLNNTSKLVAYNGSWINICGLEEYTLGRFNPDFAFKHYQAHYPGIILSHNPDILPMLKHYPGNLILAGHTHGGQVNLPILWKRFTRIEHDQFKRGLKTLDKKWVYINRGISSLMKFRWFATPELTFITLHQGKI